ncbi:MAG: class I SAM-dependent methyltransferase [Solirubrobacteraceae bacterium]
MVTSEFWSSELTDSTSRAVREAESYDEGEVWRNIDLWHRRVMHVLACPNTISGERSFDALLVNAARGAHAMDVGCGRGGLSRRLHAMGAASVYGFDISGQEVHQAREECRGLQDVSFAVHGAEAPIEGRFDLIVGRSILHHLDFREVLPRLYERNLTPGGRMVFMEPMSHPLTLAFHHFVRSAHTVDEWPLTPADILWLRERFTVHVMPINLVSFPAGVLSSLLLRSPDNPLMRIADAVDRSLERRPFFTTRGRQGIIVIDG